MGVPRIVVNAKVYAEACGEPGRALARALQEEARRAGETIGYAPPQTELALLGSASLAPLRLFAQATDDLRPGVGTGGVTAGMVAASGAAGSLLNHAERKLPLDALARAVGHLREAGLAVIVCADSLDEARRVAPLRPDAVAIEPPQLIGGDVSVTSADPEIVRGAVRTVQEAAPGVAVVCGAGVKTGNDVRAALQLGAHGVLLASGVVKAKDPAAALRDLASGLTGTLQASRS